MRTANKKTWIAAACAGTFLLLVGLYVFWPHTLHVEYRNREYHSRPDDKVEGCERNV